MRYLTGATNYADEPALIEAGVGLVARPGNSYWRWVHRYPLFGADVGMGWMEVEPYLDFLDRLPRERCLLPGFGTFESPSHPFHRHLTNGRAA